MWRSSQLAPYTQLLTTFVVDGHNSQNGVLYAACADDMTRKILESNQSDDGGISVFKLTHLDPEEAKVRNLPRTAFVLTGADRICVSVRENIAPVWCMLSSVSLKFPRRKSYIFENR